MDERDEPVAMSALRAPGTTIRRDHLAARLRLAPNAETVLALVNEYLSLACADEHAPVPVTLPRHIADREDINYWALKLARDNMNYRGSKQGAAWLDEAARFLADAAHRLARLSEWDSRGTR